MIEGIFCSSKFVSCHWEHALVFSLVRIYLHGLKGCGKSRSERNQIGDLGKCWKSEGSCGRNPYILKVHADVQVRGSVITGAMDRFLA